MARFSKELYLALIVAALGLVTVVLVGMLYAFSELSQSRADKEKLAVIREEIEAYVEERRAALATARANAPEDTGIPADWDSVETVTKWKTPYYEALFVLVDAFLDSPGGPDEEAYALLEDEMKPARIAKKQTPLEKSIDPAVNTHEEIMAHLEEFLVGLEELRYLERAVKLGIFNPPSSDPLVMNLVTDLRSVAELLAARAVFEVRDGRIEEGNDTCVSIRRLSEFLAKGGSLYWYMGKCSLDGIADQVMWRIMDAVDVNDDMWRSFRALTEERKSKSELQRFVGFSSVPEYEYPISGFLDFFNLIALNILIGDMTGGELEAADSVLALIDEPPYRVREGIESLKSRSWEDTSLSASSIVSMGIGAYTMHALNAAMEDVVKLVHALKKLKAATGTYPDSLDVLWADKPDLKVLDPLNGEAVRYRRVDDGFQLSMMDRFGENAKDTVVWWALN